MTITPALPAERPPILLIDDDELIARSLRDYLVAKGLHVDVALEPSSAGALMALRQYGAIVVDPYLTGGIHNNVETSLVGTIRSLQPHSTIVVLTGYGSPTLLHAAASDESTIVVSKPQSVTGLGELLHNIPIRKSNERSL
jgi:DNA-binding NtrC family response regulator